MAVEQPVQQRSAAAVVTAQEHRMPQPNAGPGDLIGTRNRRTPSLRFEDTGLRIC